VFVMVLAYSRMLFVQVVWDLTNASSRSSLIDARHGTQVRMHESLTELSGQLLTLPQLCKVRPKRSAGSSGPRGTSGNRSWRGAPARTGRGKHRARRLSARRRPRPHTPYGPIAHGGRGLRRRAPAAARVAIVDAHPGASSARQRRRHGGRELRRQCLLGACPIRPRSAAETARWPATRPPCGFSTGPRRSSVTASAGVVVSE